MELFRLIMSYIVPSTLMIDPELADFLTYDIISRNKKSLCENPRACSYLLQHPELISWEALSNNNNKDIVKCILMKNMRKLNARAFSLNTNSLPIFSLIDNTRKICWDNFYCNLQVPIEFLDSNYEKRKDSLSGMAKCIYRYRKQRDSIVSKNYVLQEDLKDLNWDLFCKDKHPKARKIVEMEMRKLPNKISSSSKALREVFSNPLNTYLMEPEFNHYFIFTHDFQEFNAFYNVVYLARNKNPRIASYAISTYFNNFSNERRLQLIGHISDNPVLLKLVKKKIIELDLVGKMRNYSQLQSMRQYVLDLMVHNLLQNPGIFKFNKEKHEENINEYAIGLARYVLLIRDKEKEE